MASVAITTGGYRREPDDTEREKLWTLHRESQLQEAVDSDDDFADEQDLEKWRNPRNQRPVTTKPLPSPPRPLLPKRAVVTDTQIPTAPSQHRDSFEQKLLAAKGLSNLPDMMQIPWYHPNITRHIAESILLSKQTPDGTFLLRRSSEEWQLTVSVRCKTSVKHYRVSWDGKHLCFGLGTFANLDEFTEHFASQPMISGESGLLVKLKYPYPRGVKEPIDYEEAVVFTGLDAIGVTEESLLQSQQSFSLNSKEGYLCKQGFHVKNWKYRWFKLFRNELAYYINKASTNPKRVIDLSDASRVDRDETIGKAHCFRLVTSYRTFFMQAKSENEANEWVAILRWKLKTIKAGNSSSRIQTDLA